MKRFKYLYKIKNGHVRNCSVIHKITLAKKMLVEKKNPSTLLLYIIQLKYDFLLRE